ncbi:hypothetical protein LEP1GSC103_2524 [Leptospira borgpetersenii serovar Javanica str. UI 09931]|uniref:Uncharacterized protein n=5 Tax=Leptospira borgpetersenii TaxID=174 RepID=M3HLI1_LEPBO|nr:hypothetical protein LBBP_00025 [Leptospira borgpetersenii serovar Ballum]EKP13111.1 hypothetical protein LEP1GSC128_3626 [Leptospira borgpetersenii str. 200801926]EKQ91099.1 hypothetical protein LEP1GSC101_0924 [Leptospira borgpetersenii str. UI 09149]EKR01689.1 hypothetical protein LEP1GSC121_0295 [Leptospira borgpetersenii serovar Castellonis str. 200801910]EMF98504.1 hypothetical protein LEP1GSC123_2111 [Leptospira borgpetersenii str. 200701203]EMK14593.1 hypothetical protein LEP1GSC066
MRSKTSESESYSHENRTDKIDKTAKNFRVRIIQPNSIQKELEAKEIFPKTKD